jgi:hypothetical protein
VCSGEHCDVDHDLFIELQLDVEFEFEFEFEFLQLVDDDDHQYDNQRSAARKQGGARRQWNRPAGSTTPDDQRHVDGLALAVHLRLAAVPDGVLHDRSKRQRTELFARILRCRVPVGVRRYRHEQRRLDQRDQHAIVHGGVATLTRSVRTTSTCTLFLRLCHQQAGRNRGTHQRRVLVVGGVSAAHQ